MQFSLRSIFFFTTILCLLLGMACSVFGLITVSLALGLCSVIGLAFVPYSLIRVAAIASDPSDRSSLAPALVMVGICLLPLVLLAIVLVCLTVNTYWW